MPMPVSETANSTKLLPLLTLRAASLTSPALVNLQALLRRLSRICRSRMGSTVSAPRFSWASTTRRFLFCSASCPAVPMTSLISGASCTVCGLSSSFPASIFDRSSTWLIRPRRWVPARFTRCSGSCAFSVPKRAALVTNMSVSPMMAFSGVRSSWLTLETNCDLCLAGLLELPVLLLNFVEQPHVLDRDRSLVRERADQLNLLVGERPDLGARQCQNAHPNALAQHRNAEHSTIPA